MVTAAAWAGWAECRPAWGCSPYRSIVPSDRRPSRIFARRACASGRAPFGETSMLSVHSPGSARPHGDGAAPSNACGQAEEEPRGAGVVRVSPFESRHRHLRALHDERPELAPPDIEPEVRPFHVAVEGADRHADGHLPSLHETDVVVPEDEAAEATLVPQLEVDDPSGRAVLAGERPDWRDAGDRGPEVRLHPFLELRDPLERGDAPTMTLDDDHRGRVPIEEGAPLLDDGVDLSLECVRVQEILHLLIEGRAHRRRTRERTKGLSRAQPTGCGS